MPRVAVIGAGLIGGSLLLALRRAGATLLAIDPDEKTRRALDALAVDTSAMPDERLRDCDLVVLATPLPAVLALLAPVGAILEGTPAVLTDVAGAKVKVLEAAGALPSTVSFVGGHPMAGRERGGFANASESLFEGRTVALCASGKTPPEATDRVAAMWRLTGGDTLRCEAAAHDEAVGRVSHLPYFAACATALVAGEGDELARKLAAGGLRDTTRVASDRTLRFAAEANATVPARLREAARRLEAFADALEQGSRPDALLDEAARARARLVPER